MDPGELSVTLRDGVGLKNCDWFGQQDPYVILRCGNQQYRSNTHVSGGETPVWNQVFVFKVTNETELSLVVWDQDELKADDCVGKATVDLREVRRAAHGSQELVVPLRRPITRRQQGSVRLALSFIPGLAPGSVRASFSSQPSAGPYCALGGDAPRLSSSGVTLQEAPASWYPATSRPLAATRPAGDSNSNSGIAPAGSWHLEDSASFHTAPAPVLEPHPARQSVQPVPSAPSYHYQQSSSYGESAHAPNPHFQHPPSAAPTPVYPTIHPEPAMLSLSGPYTCSQPVQGPQSPYSASGSAHYGAPPEVYTAPPPPVPAVAPGYAPYGAPAPYGPPPASYMTGPVLYG